MELPSHALRGSILHFLNDPACQGEPAWQYLEDGLLWIEQGHIKACGPAAEWLDQLPADLPLTHYPDHLILPGFIDTHTHYPQTGMIAAHGEQLLDWLNTYTFPTEMRFADGEYARAVAEVFLDELLRNGTTTALVFCTVHPQSVDSFFAAAQARGLRMIAGKVMMDRHAPAALRDNADTGFAESRALIERWHGVDRLQYALTPRFAVTSSAGQLQRAGELLAAYPGVYLQTHLAENHAEVAWVHELFPDATDYLDVYDRAGLLGRRSVFAHGIHLSERECARLGQAGSAVAHCPGSNLFLGSGLLDLPRLQQYGVRVGLGSDVGAGTSFSLLQILGDAYKVQQLQGNSLCPFQSLYLATLGGARALDLQDSIGNFLPGKEADLCVLNLAATPLLRFRMQQCVSLQEKLFVLTTLGDDRVVAASYAMGRRVHENRLH